MNDFLNQLVFNDIKGLVLFYEGKYIDVKIYFEVVKIFDGKDGSIYDYFGDIEFKLGNYIRVVEYWIKVWEFGVKFGVFEIKIKMKIYYVLQF